MNYPKSLFYNFLTVFFANYIIPGIEITSYTKLPHFGADIPFAIVVGVLNSLIYPVLKKVDHRVSMVRIGLVALVLNFAIYGILKILPIGIHIFSIEGYLIPSLIVAAASFTTNYLALRAGNHHGGSGHVRPQSHHAFRNDEPKMPE